MTERAIFAGIDVGASRTKAAILDADKHLIGRAVEKSGTDFSATAKVCLNIALKMADACEKDIVRAVSTGYGRKNVGFVTEDSKTEIS